MKIHKLIVIVMMAAFSNSVFANAGWVVMQENNKRAEQERINSQVQSLPLLFDSFHVVDNYAWERHHFEIDGVSVSRIVVCDKGKFTTMHDKSKPFLERLQVGYRVCVDNKGNQHKAFSIDEFMQRHYKGVVEVVGQSIYQGNILVFYNIKN